MKASFFSIQLTPRLIICACLLLMPLTVFSQQSDFKSYTQDITGTSLLFDMVAISGGEFKMGSPDEEAGRRADEGPQEITGNLYRRAVI